MNGDYFISELSRQIKAVQALGECHNGWITSYADYNKATDTLIKFVKANKLNIMACIDCIYRIDYNWSSADRIANDIIDLLEVGDYAQALEVLNKHNTVWKYRNKLNKITITLFD